MAVVQYQREAAERQSAFLCQLCVLLFPHTHCREQPLSQNVTSLHPPLLRSYASIGFERDQLGGRAQGTRSLRRWSDCSLESINAKCASLIQNGFPRPTSSTGPAQSNKHQLGKRCKSTSTRYVHQPVSRTRTAHFFFFSPSSFSLLFPERN